MRLADASGSLSAAAVSSPVPMVAKVGTEDGLSAAVVPCEPVTRRDILATRRGLTMQARPAAWMWLSAASSKRSAAQLTFHQLACCDRVPDETLYAIEEDCRTMSLLFPNPLFSTPRGVDALSRLLMAFYQRNPESGYVRGHTARLAALLLAVHGLRNLENAFWNFCALAEDRLNNHCDGKVLLGACVEQRVFERLVQKKLPGVAEHLVKVDLPLSTLTQGWFSSCFVSVLPVETAMRIMDSVMAEGTKVLHRVALALLKRHEAAIVSCARGDNLRKVLEGRMVRATGVDELMQMSFNCVGSLPGSLLATYRASERQAVSAELAAAKQRNDQAGVCWIGSVSSGFLSYGRSGSSRSLASARSLSSSGRSE